MSSGTEEIVRRIYVAQQESVTSVGGLCCYFGRFIKFRQMLIEMLGEVACSGLGVEERTYLAKLIVGMI
jgi:hypothetical protein